jgi:hypothetical protein
MDVASVIAAIGFGAALFMLWFLSRLLKEGFFSAVDHCFATVDKTIDKRTEDNDIPAGDVTGFIGEGFNRSRPRANSVRYEYCGALLTKGDHEKERFYIRLDTLHASIHLGKLGWRAIHPKHLRAIRQYHF